MNGITLEPACRATDDVRLLVGELDRTLAREYRPEQCHGLPVEALFEPHMRFFIARLDGVAVGCAGVALYEDFAEVKRMYVRADARGLGVAQALLTVIERETRQNGLSILRLETGERQFAAIRLYERCGFRRCDAFGNYASLEPAAIATSVFFEKRLGGEGLGAGSQAR